MIKPTVGRVVWFTPSSIPYEGFTHHDVTQPCAAMVTYVWGDRLVNLVVFDSNGVAFGKTSVLLLQDGDLKPDHGYFCSWMPYQLGQAAKVSEIAAAADAARSAMAVAIGSPGRLIEVAGAEPAGNSPRQPHQQRVVIEQAELQEKVNKLAAFTIGRSFQAVDKAEQDRLKEQFQHMTGYNRMLLARIAAFA